eukprot:127681-Prymnesium_polylepis.1
MSGHCAPVWYCSASHNFGVRVGRNTPASKTPSAQAIQPHLTTVPTHTYRNQSQRGVKTFEGER